MTALTVREWSLDEFVEGREAWNELVADSDADPLFCSHTWLLRWWRAFAQADTPWARRLRPVLLAVQDESERLHGLWPLYIDPARIKGVLPTRRLQQLGNSWRAIGGVRTEYTGPIVRTESADAALAKLLAHVGQRRDWDEMVLIDLPAASRPTQAIRQFAAEQRWHTRELEQDRTYVLDLREGFEAWLGRRSKKVRRAVMNERKRLAKLGEVAIVDLGERGVAQALDLLNEMKAARWGKPTFDEDRLAFHTALAERWQERGGLRFTGLTLNGEVISIIYDIRSGRRQVSIQMAFQPGVADNLSLNFQHIGHELEAAAAAGVEEYDLLAGGGKQTQYKERLADTGADLTTLVAVRSRLHKLVYKLTNR